MKIRFEVELDEQQFGFWSDATSEKKSVINQLQQWLSYPNTYDFRKFISTVNIIEENQHDKQN